MANYDPTRPLASNRGRRNTRNVRVMAQVGKLRTAPAEPLHFLAKKSCHSCAGTGSRKTTTCSCIYRRVSRVAISRLLANRWAGPRENWHAFSRNAEYEADLQLIAKRALDAIEFEIWREFHVERRPFYELLKLTAGDRGQFFHAVYRCEQKFGAALLSAADCFPPDVYFSGLQHVGPAPEERTASRYWLPLNANPGADDDESRLELSGDDELPDAA